MAPAPLMFMSELMRAKEAFYDYVRDTVLRPVDWSDGSTDSR
jgi:hypothetical protein